MESSHTSSAARGVRSIDEVRADVSHAIRKMRTAPAFTFVVVSILAIGIGANVAVFTVIDAVLLRMLPVTRPHELREIAWIERRAANLKVAYSGGMRPLSTNELLATSFAYPVYVHLRDHSTAFADLVLFDRRAIDVRASGRRQRVTGLLASGNFLSGLGVAMAIGRPIAADDDRAGAPAVAVLSVRVLATRIREQPGGAGPDPHRQRPANDRHRCDRPQFRGHRARYAGRRDRAHHDAPRGLRRTAGCPRESAGTWRFGVMGRVRPGVGDERVQAETQALVRQAVPASVLGGEPHEGLRVAVLPGGQGLDTLRRSYGRPLSLLMAIMAIVLLVACANVAGLLLMRAATRQREMSVRLTLGASRARLIRQLLTESTILAGLGGALGVAIATAASGHLLPMLDRERVPELEPGVGPSSLFFSVALCLIVGLLCGLVPALRASRHGLTSLRSAPGSSAGPSRSAGGQALIAVQVALSLVLLVGAGLFVRTLVNLRSQAIGFRPDHILLFDVDAAASGYEKARLHDFHERVLHRVTAIPGVRAASLSRYALLSGNRTTDTIVIPGAPVGQDEIRVHLHHVSPRHPETMGISLLAGRDFTAQDREGAPRVALANQALAQLLGGTVGALRRRILYAQPDSGVEIVGIVADARLATLRESAPPTLYLPYRQYPQGRVTFAARVAGAPLAIADQVRRAVQEIDPNVPLLAIRTQEAQIDAVVARERLFAWVASAFAALALGLACLGIYGTLAYSVARRTAEIGLRMALGAGRRQVVSMVIRESLLPVGVGLAFGLVLVASTTRFIQTMLFGLTPHDGPTVALAALGLVSSAFVAAWLPSRRASRIDPMTALRSE